MRFCKLVASICLFAGHTAFGGTTIYVAQGQTGLNDGTSWCDAFTSLQDALHAASSGDIVKVAGGHYQPGTDLTFNVPAGVTVWGGFDTAPSGWDTGLGSDTYLEGAIGACGPHPCSGDAASVVTLLAPSSGTATTTLKRMASVNGGFNGVGAGVTANSTSLDVIIDNVEVNDNTSDSTAGVFIHARNITLTLCRLHDNRAMFGGSGGLFPPTRGGAYLEASSSITIDKCEIRANSAYQIGGVRCEAPTVVVKRSAVVGNTVNIQGAGLASDAGARAGGLSLYGCTYADIYDCFISENGANDRSGGVAIVGNTAVRFWHSYVGANTAKGDGPGIYAECLSADFINLLISSNNGQDPTGNLGGGILIDGATANIVNCTVTDNSVGTSAHGGGVFGKNSATIAVDNSIFWNNFGQSGTLSDEFDLGLDGSSSVCINHSDFENFPSVAGCGGGTGNLSNQDPLFVTNMSCDFKWYAHSVPTLQLSAGSPCRDAGSTSTLTAFADPLDVDFNSSTSGIVPYDLTLIQADPCPHVARVLNSVIDMGAFETPGVVSTPCAADWDGSGSLTVGDIFAFLADWFSGCTGPNIPPPCYGAADFNHMGGITVQDIFDYLAAWFAGC